MKAIKIKWDVENEEDLEFLPSEIDIPADIEDEDEISDYISEYTGFCHFGFELIEISIRDLAYQLYIIDWKHNQITPQIEADTWKNYFETLCDYVNRYSFDEYLFENGYASGTLYVCYDEFLNAEYLDENYMKELFDNEKLFNLYLEDLETNFYTD